VVLGWEKLPRSERSRGGSLAVLCAVILLPCVLPAAVKEGARHGDSYSRHAVLGFTRHLIAKKEYYRAHAELIALRSIIRHNPDGARLRDRALSSFFTAGDTTS
jgi:hypothetical protein